MTEVRVRDTRPYRVLSGVITTFAILAEETAMWIVPDGDLRRRVVDEIDNSRRVADYWVSRVFTDH